MLSSSPFCQIYLFTIYVPFPSSTQAAYNYDGATIGRLVFEVKTAPNATAQRTACGTAGGKAFDLLPKNYAVTSLGVACAPATGSGRKLHQSSVGISAKGLTVEAGPVSSLEANAATIAEACFTCVDLYAFGFDLYDSALPKPPPPTNVFTQENTTLVYEVAVSSDGLNLAAVLEQDPYTLATSKDGGATFNAYQSFETDAITANNAWTSLASSGDGQVLVAAHDPWLNVTEGLESVIVQNGDLWTSRDGGVAWRAANLPGRGNYAEFFSVCSSADGMTLVALALFRDGTIVDVSYDDDIASWDFEDTSPGTTVAYVSSDGGSSWSKQPLGSFGQQLSYHTLRPLQISTDSTRLFLALESQLLASEDNGMTWNSIFTASDSSNIYDASNIYDYSTGGSNGSSIVVLDDEGIHESSDGGRSFALADVGEEEAWDSVAISRNGEFIAVASSLDNNFAVSKDAGETWEQLPVNPSYWTIAGVSDTGRITSVDGAFNLWTQNTASSRVSKLNAAPSVVGAALRPADVASAPALGLIAAPSVVGARGGSVSSAPALGPNVYEVPPTPPNPNNLPTVLVIDRYYARCPGWDKRCLELSNALKGSGFNVVNAIDVKDALDKFFFAQRLWPDIVFTRGTAYGSFATSKPEDIGGRFLRTLFASYDIPRPLYPPVVVWEGSYLGKRGGATLSERVEAFRKLGAAAVISKYQYEPFPIQNTATSFQPNYREVALVLRAALQTKKDRVWILKVKE